MDFDSSTKFISSLAKFLQSLCNGYVEFDSGVHVIGHLYLSVDTGKTIDYVLNEKVCKTDENSVTFISNSFHAEPAEKPKSQNKKATKETDKVESKNEDNGLDIEPKSTNFGTIPSQNMHQNSPHSQGSKRAHSPTNRTGSSKSGRTSPRHKKSRTDSLDQSVSHTPNPASENSIASVSSPTDDGTVHGNDQYGSYQQSYFHSADDDNSLAEDSEERDIKPAIDTDVTFIKEEYGTSSSQPTSQNRDRSRVDDSSGFPLYQSNPVFPGSSFAGQAGFGVSGSQRSGFGDRSSNMFQAPGASTEGGESAGDPTDMWTDQDPASAELDLFPSSLVQDSAPLHSIMNNTTGTCVECGKSIRNQSERLAHRSICKGATSLICPKCGTAFNRKDNLRVHLRNKHNIGNPTVCVGCGMTFRSYVRLNEHMQICALVNHQAP